MSKTESAKPTTNNLVEVARLLKADKRLESRISKHAPLRLDDKGHAKLYWNLFEIVDDDRLPTGETAEIVLGIIELLDAWNLIRVTSDDEKNTRHAMNALADLFERDAKQIAADPRYAQPDSSPLPFVKELQQQARELRREANASPKGAAV